MHGRRTIVQILSDFKKTPDGDKAVGHCTHAITMLPRAEIINAFLALPCFLEFSQVESCSAKLIQLVKMIDTIDCHIETGKTTLVKERDKDIISNIQKELIQYTLRQLLDGPLHIKTGIKQLLNVTDYNLSATSLVLASVMNIMMYVANFVAVRCAADSLDSEHWAAISGALLNLAQVEKLVQEALDRAFLTTLRQPRKTFVDIIRVNEAAYVKQIASAKKMIESKDPARISRSFDCYPDLLDDRFLSLFSTKYREYVNRINQKSLVYKDQQAIDLKLDCEDSHWLEEFERCIILVGILDLLDGSHHIRQDVRDAITVSGEIDSARLLGAYVSAVNTSIIDKAHSSNIKSANNDDKLAIEPAIWGALNHLRSGWIRDVLHDRGYVFVANNNHEVNQLPSYFPGVGFVAAVTAAAAATVAVLGFFAHYQQEQNDSVQEKLSPQFKPH